VSSDEPVSEPARGALVGISLKMYMGAAQTRTWVGSLRAVVEARARSRNLEVFVLPSFPMLESTSALLADSAIHWGAQDLAPDPSGAQTGEVAGSVLRELGCTRVEIGHSERRRLFGETDGMVIDKMRQAFSNDLTPVLCVGETTRGAARFAAEFCIEQLQNALAGDLEHDVVVAYEPVWAIGVDKPADPEHVQEVCSALRTHTANRPGRTSLLYGGSAGPGTFGDLGGSVDGLFLGRFAHNLANVAAVLDEVESHSRCGTRD
jgi:triosephosphate isomerase